MTVVAACSPGEIRVAAAQAGEWLDYAVWRPGDPDGVGDVHRGRVTAVVPGLAGAFVAIGNADGFLPDSAGAAGRGIGDTVAVCVTRAAQGGKGPRLAVLDEPPGQGPPACLRRGPNPVQRLAALHGGPVLVDDPGFAATLRPAFGDRVRVAPVPEAFAALADSLAQPEVSLPGGMRASIHPTPALVAIDVDMAAATGAGPKQRTQLAANRAMLPALARQIRLRSLSGAILVDLAGLPVKRRADLTEPLRQALAPDPARPRLLGFTALGLAEITRPRLHPPLHEILAGPHAAGLAALRAIAAAAPTRPVLLRAAPTVTAALHADPAALADLARRLGQPIALRSDPTLPPGTTVVEDALHG